MLDRRQGLSGRLRPDLSEDRIQGLNPGRERKSVGVDRVNFLLNALEVVPQEQVLNSLRLFAKEVMPHFQSSDAAAAAAGGR